MISNNDFQFSYSEFNESDYLHDFSEVLVSVSEVL